MFKLITRVLLFLLLGSGVALADWNIRQDGSGETLWRSNRSGNEIHVGAPYLLYETTGFTAGTHYIVSPITASITRIDAVLDQVITSGTSTFTFWVEASSGTGDFRQVSGAGGQTSFVLWTGTGAGNGEAITPTGSNVVGKGKVFGIREAVNSTVGGGNTRFIITLTPQ